MSGLHEAKIAIGHLQYHPFCKSPNPEAKIYLARWSGAEEPAIIKVVVVVEVVITEALL